MNTRKVQKLLTARFPRRRAVITGGGSGLGLAAARLLAADGWKLALLDCDAARLTAAAQELPGIGAAEVATATVDTRDEAAVRRAIADFAIRHEGLDLALNAAGVAVGGTFMETPATDWEWVLHVNVLGVANACRIEIPHMQAAGGGLIINVASIAGVVSGADSSAYSASKAAVISLSEALAQEQCQHGIQVSVAMPGFFRTHLMDRARAPAATLELARKLIRASNLEADEVAREILGRAAGGRTYLVLPRQYRFLWRFKRFAPARFQRFMTRFRSQLEARARAAGGSDD